mmetsp:Transcript_7648/g.28163  ORF Transcript_7648/g.28163 Transcript_7648/m.28163 type:complete len:202 (+) Transcript_7648:674-1279(+)
MFSSSRRFSSCARFCAISGLSLSSSMRPVSSTAPMFTYRPSSRFFLAVSIWQCTITLGMVCFNRKQTSATYLATFEAILRSTASVRRSMPSVPVTLSMSGSVGSVRKKSAEMCERSISTIVPTIFRASSRSFTSALLAVADSLVCIMPKRERSSEAMVFSMYCTRIEWISCTMLSAGLASSLRVSWMRRRYPISGAMMCGW